MIFRWYKIIYQKTKDNMSKNTDDNMSKNTKE